MTFIVVHPKVCTGSAQRLAKALGGLSWNPRKEGFPRIKYPVQVTCFNYGFGDIFPMAPGSKYYNPPAAIRVSTDKIKSYAAFKKAGVPTCNYVTNEKDVPKDWHLVVSREVVNGRNCEGVMICPRDDLVHGCPLYTEYFEHDEEHRIVVFQGKVLARYMKENLQDGCYELTHMLPRGYEELDKTAIAAAKAVGLDYAGVDLLYNSDDCSHICLEINSGPLLTDEVEEQLVKILKG